MSGFLKTLGISILGSVIVSQGNRFRIGRKILGTEAASPAIAK